jgi:hypothetical protein
MTYTANKIKEEITPEIRKKMLEDLAKYEAETGRHKSSPHEEDIWIVGEWIDGPLEAAGATKEEIRDICFVLGQRCWIGDPYDWAAKLLNEFINSGTTKDRPGYELGIKICDELGLTK